MAESVKPVLVRERMTGRLVRAMQFIDGASPTVVLEGLGIEVRPQTMAEHYMRPLDAVDVLATDWAVQIDDRDPLFVGAAEFDRLYEQVKQ